MVVTHIFKWKNQFIGYAIRQQNLTWLTHFIPGISGHRIRNWQIFLFFGSTQEEYPFEVSKMLILRWNSNGASKNISVNIYINLIDSLVFTTWSNMRCDRQFAHNWPIIFICSVVTHVIIVRLLSWKHLEATESDTWRNVDQNLWSANRQREPFIFGSAKHIDFICQ